MDISHREELISAYLDGELSAAEQQQVLQLLSEDEAANKLFSEFQLLRKSLRTLPAEQLNEDFTREVIERVKQRSPEPLPASLSQDISGRSAETPAWGRILLWPALAVAAAILLMVFYDQPDSSQHALEPVGGRKTDSLARIDQSVQQSQPAQVTPGLETERPTIQSATPSPETPAFAREDRSEIASQNLIPPKAIQAPPRPIPTYTFAVKTGVDLRRQLARALSHSQRRGGEVPQTPAAKRAPTRARAPAAGPILLRSQQSHHDDRSTQYVYELEGDPRTIERSLNRLQATGDFRLVSVTSLDSVAKMKSSSSRAAPRSDQLATAKDNFFEDRADENKPRDGETPSAQELAQAEKQRAAAAAPKKPAAEDLAVNPFLERLQALQGTSEMPEEFEHKGAEEASEAEGTAPPAKSTYRVRLILLVKRGQEDSPQGKKGD